MTKFIFDFIFYFISLLVMAQTSRLLGDARTFGFKEFFLTTGMGFVSYAFCDVIYILISSHFI